MSRKKIIISVISVLLVCSLVAGGIVVARNANAEKVLVIPVSDISMSWYSGESMEGQISANVTQKVTLEKDSIIENTYVGVGDHVRRGDKLLSFDMTLKEMELEIAVLTRQQQQQNLKKAQDRLTSLKNGGPIEENTGTDAVVTPGSVYSNDADEDSDTSEDNEIFPDDLDTTEEPGSLATTNAEGTKSTSIAVGWAGLFGGNSYTVAASFPSLISFEAETEDEPDTGAEEIPDEPEQGFTVEEPPAELEEDRDPVEDENGNLFYKVLTTIEESHSGSGTKEDPYVFLCSSEAGRVIVMGSFLNEAAGYDAEGVEQLSEDGFWFRLEFHEEDTWSTEDQGETSLTGYYVRNGGLLTNPVDPEEETVYEMNGAISPGFDLDPEQVVTPTPTPEPENPDDFFDDGYYDDGYYDDGDDGQGTTLTREEAIKQQERQVSELELQIRASNIKISRLQRELEKKTVTSTVNGVVKSMGDPVTGNYSGDAFMVIESDGGYYVEGNISELMLDTLNVGDMLTCTSYETGNVFQAEITEVSEYPADSGSYYGSGNTNSSYYPFVAAVQEDVELSNGEGVNITLDNLQSQDLNSIDLPQAFVRSENGQYYVYKDENGRLKKQIVEARVSTDGYSIQILSGLTQEDKVAFPYGNEIKDGAKTKEGTMDELYGY